ncbi:MAG: hypothetical protein EZS28_011499 [Streblomastix strix]|uniref:Uncharacterized protein n=1 Tax=Streblomastix strix TaxID=222440 RepID=A0A5J4WF02_9EUKA|nr:MAG: hypothetical protein EZS28_011499 [Streblomastix strix]
MTLTLARRIDASSNLSLHQLLIQQELARQTLFRGYYLLNADITNLPSSATGDFAFSTESGTVWMYESAWYDSGQLVPDQVTPASDELPIVNGEASAGISTSYSREDHIHPQQLTYDNDITATKFIKSGGTATEILLANGDITTIDSKISRTYSSGTGGYIRLCVFPIGTSTGTPYIQFQVTCNTNSMQTIDLLPYYTVNGIIDLFGNITAPSYIQPTYNIYYGVDQLLHTHTGSYSSAVYTAWIHMMTGSGSVTVTVSKQSTYFPQRVTEILTQDIVSSISGSQTQIPISYNIDNGGIINNIIQINPLDRNYTTDSNGIRMGNNNGDSTASLYFGCLKSATNTTQSGQWEISKTSDRALTINPSSLRQTDHSVGLIGTSLYINQQGSNLSTQYPDSKLVTNYVLNAGSSDSFAGVKCGIIQIQPNGNNFNEELRISRSTVSNYSGIYLGCNPSQTSGALTDQWSIVNTPTGELRIGVGDQFLNDNKGLIISADGNTLSFNGSVIAGTGASNGASNGSVNYSADNSILWGLNSVDTNGGFYSDGPKTYWRAKPVTLGAVTP